MPMQPTPAFAVTIEKTPSPGATVRLSDIPVAVTRSGPDSWTVSLKPQLMIGLPDSQLAGMVSLALAEHFLDVHAETFVFNFKQTILTRFSVSGSAVQFLRRMVFHLERSLKRSAATDLLVRLDQGRDLLTCFYYAISPCAHEQENYQHLLKRSWMRAMFISAKCIQYLPARRLEMHGIAQGLDSYWWSCHGFFTAEDRETMTRLAAKAQGERSYTDRLLGMFEVIAKRLLW